MKRSSNDSYKICSNLPPKQLGQADSTGSSDTRELIKRSLNMVNELSSLLEKDSGDGEVNGPSSVRRCNVAPQPSRKQTRGRDIINNVSRCSSPDVQLTGRESQKSTIANPESGNAKRKINSEEMPCLQPTDKRPVNGFSTIPLSILAGRSRGRLQSGVRYSETSDEESADDEEDSNDDEIETWLQGIQFQNICISKDYKGDEIVSSKMVKYVLQTFQIASEKYSQAKALKILKRRFRYLANQKKCLGTVPGVEVGDFFYDKVELSITGLHHDLHAGIDCIEHHGITVAASILASGFHGDNTYGSDILIYPGSAGFSGYSLKRGRLSIDRKLELGILALKSSIEACTPVRVIYSLGVEGSRDSDIKKSKKVAAYIYDGLYLVERYWFVTKGDGFSTYSFQLRRKPEQQKFDIKELWVSRPLKMRFGLRMEDISEGKEKNPVTVVNIIDDDLPDSFTYITQMIYPSQYKLNPPCGCDCINGCSDSVGCACVIKNGGELPFNCEGGIVRAKPLVYECGPACKCPPSCQNRVSQLGFEYRLEVFKTQSRGWGIRSLDKIPSGSFVCEYVGEMLEDAEAGKRQNDEYLFDIGRNYNDKSLWEGLPSIPSLKKVPNGRKKGGFTIDAVSFGNVGRFINHCCSPNLYAQNILYNHDDQRLPRIMLFATEDIFPLEELTYHYNYRIDGVRDSDGKIRKKDCLCGSDECIGRLY